MFAAYQYVTVAILLSNANFLAEKLDLPLKRPITESSLTFKLVAPPTVVQQVGPGGRIDSGNYMFSVGGPPHEHCFITKLDPFGELSAAEQNRKLSQEKSLINGKDAYRLACEWLKVCEADVSILEKANKPEVRQRWFWGDGNPARKVLLPIFYVRWGPWDDAKVEIAIDGRNKELLELRLLDRRSYTHRPTALVKNLDALLAIPDEEFQGYSLLQRSNLLARFCAANYLTSGNKLGARGSAASKNADSVQVFHADDLPSGVPHAVDTNGNVVFVEPQFTTRAFQEEGLRLVIEEANTVAKELRLPESLPIVRSNLTACFISPFGYTYIRKKLGNITTSNYWYGVEQNFRFSDLVIVNFDQRCAEYSKKYQWPISRLDTNVPYQLATQWLAAVHMDVGGISRDCEVHVSVDPYWNHVELGEVPKHKFTPIYCVWWKQRGGTASKSGAATVELFLPKKELLQMVVSDPKYILRPPLVFTNLDALFPGKAEITTNKPGPLPPLVQ